MPDTEQDRKAGWIPRWRLILAVPAAVVALLSLFEQFPRHLAWTVGVIACLVLLWAILGGVALFWRRHLSAPFSRWIATAPAIAHLDQVKARLKAKFYTWRLSHDRILLNMSVREFARGAGLSLLRAWAVLQNPDVIMREEKQVDTEAALLLPPGFFCRGCAKDGTKYGEEMTRARLKWFIDRRLVRIHLKKNDPRMRTPESRARLLYRLEKELVEGLREQGRLEEGN